jgi:hypothetical protein
MSQTDAQTAAIEASKNLTLALQYWTDYPCEATAVAFMEWRSYVHQVTGDLEL